ncbi:MAG: peptide antibiotic transporter SbmA [Flavobacteriaceae bacterium]
MFQSFFPDPRRFFLSAVLWTALAMLCWYGLARDLGESLSLGGLIGYGYPTPLGEGADDAARGAFTLAQTKAIDVWLYQYMFIWGGLFALAWARISPHRWFRWSVLVSMVIIFITWFQVQLDVMINEWFGTFYDMVQKALGEPGSVTSEAFYGQLATFAGIALVAITVAVMTRFIVSHWIFRWRTAMNDYYTSRWDRLRHIEGASQRVQEDTMRFAAIMEGLGVSLIDSLMTLIAFLPILWGLSMHVKGLPIIGEVPQALVFVAIIWSIFGTAILALVGIRLPGLEFRNQRVEAAFRKELVFGEDNPDRAQPPTLDMLFDDVRRNYFRLYLNYLYFNVVRYGYLQAGVLVPYVALAPTIVAGGLTLGVMQQIIRAFGRVENSFQYLVNSWTTIVELMSIYKRLKAFEATLEGEELGDIEKEWVPAAPAGE